MAGSLTRRRIEAGDEVKSISVPCVPLSRFLDEPVDFLKLDIEGSEDEVLSEACDKLRNVRAMCVEYHHAFGLATDRLSGILRLLDAQGFDTHVGKSFSYQQMTHQRPLTHATLPYTANIWAVRREAAPKPAGKRRKDAPPPKPAGAQRAPVKKSAKKIR
jgi:hypothetical protein